MLTAPMRFSLSLVLLICAACTTTGDTPENDKGDSKGGIASFTESLKKPITRGPTVPM